MSFMEMLHTLLWGYPLPSEMVDPRYPLFLQQLGGLWLALTITGFSFLFGGPLALVLALCRYDRHGASLVGQPGTKLDRRAISFLATAVVEGFQSIPIMILVLMAFYLPFRLLGLRLPAIVMAVAVFSIYNGVYLSGIIRLGLSAVETGWLDAARTLGLSTWQVLWRIRLPIAMRAMLPAVLGQAITVFKDTSVLAVVAVGELTYTARQVQVSQPANYGLLLLLVLLIYWSVAAAGSVLVSRLDAAWRKRLAGQ
ncbi:MAG: ABC transporter permease subunit [Planctomycetes bacterium]|nr:ABC transporter permease subunit [Planctomycetota bacterium]